MKIAIIYRGNIRGFKYDECFKTHEKLYNVLKNNNIDFDTYLCTNNIEYDETSINKIENLKSKYILDINNVRSDNKYKQAFSNIKFTGPWSEKFQDNIITYWYNNNYLFHKIREKYDKYIIMDIAHIIEMFDISLLFTNNNYCSIYESNTGYNTRILIANYELFESIMTQFNYILNNKLSYRNPEAFNLNFLSNHNIIKTNKVKIFRIRTDKTILAF
jgi:hypothetical protein